MAERLQLLFTPELCRAAPETTLAAAIRGGVDLVQWRAKPARADLGALARCREICAALHTPLVINDDVELALEIGAAGAHVGQDDMPAAEARRRLGPDRRLGVSTHDVEQLRRAIDDGADSVGFGPMFPTETKGYGTGRPEGALRAARAAAGPIPVWAIGGIDAARLRLLIEREGCDRVAVSRAILAAADPEAAAAELRALLP